MAFIGIQFSGWNTDWRFLFLGVILLVAVLVNNYVRKRAEGAGDDRDERRGAAARGARASPSTSATSIALKDISVVVDAGEVTCVLGDNGAGKSTFIKILSGRAPATTRASCCVEGEETHFDSPREAKAARHRDGLPGPGDRAADVDLAQLLPRLGADEGRRARCGASTCKCAQRDDASTRCARWASTSATPTSRSARCPAASARRWRSPAPSTSAPRC